VPISIKNSKVFINKEIALIGYRYPVSVRHSGCE
jgi:hypothetical protein